FCRIDGAAERRSDRRNCPSRRVESIQPPDQRFVFVECDVVQERISAVEIAGNAAILNVLRDRLRRGEVDGTARAGATWKGRNGKNTGKVLNVDGCGGHPERIARNQRPEHELCYLADS